jgi:ubiquitin carboxyl-terminal hydrolase 5/13
MPQLTSDIPVKVPDYLNLDAYLGKGRQAGEEELDVDAAPGQWPANIIRGVS